MRSSANRAVLVVHLDPTAVHASWAARGPTPRRVHVPLVQSAWGGAWQSGLAEIDEALAEAVARLRVPPGTPVVVGFESRSGVAEAQSIPAGDVGAGLASLRLAACERLSLPRHSEAVRVRQVCGAEGGDSPSAGVAIVSAAAEDAVEAVRAWVERAGLRCVRAVPSGAVLLGEITRQVRGRSEGPFRILLHIDGHRSVLGVASEGRIELLRTFEIGLNNFGEAIARASQSRQDGRGAAVSLQQALELLAGRGFPKPDTVFDEEAQLSANAVLPVLQPVVQRFCVEVKQSLRMVLRRSGTVPVQVELRGPGALVPNMAEVFVNSIDAEFVPPPSGDGDRSLDVLLRESWWHDLALTSTAAVASVSAARFRKAVVLGALLGIAALGAEAAHYLRATAALATRQRAVAAELVRVHDFNELSERAVALDARLTKGRELLSEFVGPQPDWDAVVTDLALAADGQVEVTEIRAASEKDRAFLLVYGVADAAPDSAGLTSFIRGFESSPLVGRVDVESRLLIEMGDKSMYQFRLRVDLNRIRPELTTMETP
jgi:hypothetical protein